MPTTIHGEKNKLTLSGMPGKMATPKERHKAGPAPSEGLGGGSLLRASHAELIARAQALAADGEGVLVTIVSTPRSGKTDLAKKWVHQREHLGDIVLIHDPKIPPNYPWAPDGPTSLSVESVAGLESSVLRFSDAIDPEEMVTAGIEIARTGVACTSVIDENSHATKGPQTFKGPNLHRAYTEGGSQGHTLIALTQIPQWCPTVQIDFSHAVIVGRNGGRTLAYLEKQLMLTPECARAIPTLKVGEWVMVSRYEPWDRTVYYSPQEI